MSLLVSPCYYQFSILLAGRSLVLSILIINRTV
nr:MAG TPA: hypothetical protein [Caudoviricetes sp.]